MKLSILDFGSHPSQVAAHAQVLELLGYHRYWVAEHQPQADPEILVSRIGACCHKLFIGTAAVQLRYRNPVRLAQNFILLSRLFPGRIDMGLCAGGSSDPEILRVVSDRGDEYCGVPFEQVYSEVLATVLSGVATSDHNPSPPPPTPWCFGTGRNSAETAARLGVAYGYSVFHRGLHRTRDPINLYRDKFKPSAFLREPLVTVAAAGMCAASEQELAYGLSLMKNPFVEPTVIGSQRVCEELLLQMRCEFGSDEIAFLDVSPTEATSLNTYQLLAQALRLIGSL